MSVWDHRIVIHFNCGEVKEKIMKSSGSNIKDLKDVLQEKGITDSQVFVVSDQPVTFNEIYKPSLLSRCLHGLAVGVIAVYCLKDLGALAFLGY